MVFTIEYCGVPFDCDITFDEDKAVEIHSICVSGFPIEFMLNSHLENELRGMCQNKYQDYVDALKYPCDNLKEL